MKLCNLFLAGSLVSVAALVACSDDASSDTDRAALEEGAADEGTTGASAEGDQAMDGDGASAETDDGDGNSSGEGSTSSPSGGSAAEDSAGNTSGGGDSEDADSTTKDGGGDEGGTSSEEEAQAGGEGDSSSEGASQGSDDGDDPGGGEAGDGDSGDQGEDPVDLPFDEGASGSDDGERASMTRAECTAAGGTVVGDIGDGAIHRPGYTCASNGQPPIGTIQPEAGEPIAIEGEVCCGGKSDSGDSGGVDDCEQVQCFRAIECVKECGGEVLQAGCCPCPDGTFDSIECNATE